MMRFVANSPRSALQCDVNIARTLILCIGHDRRSLVRMVTNSWLEYRGFESWYHSLEETPWCSSLERRMPAEVSSSSLDHGPK
ncbi:hypothetical protein TNCV_3661701 [Trichonephila clavipes]|nr:hypothetical protein TNCV_3661701 [Trichonephila clavipes]